MTVFLLNSDHDHVGDTGGDDVHDPECIDDQISSNFISGSLPCPTRILLCKMLRGGEFFSVYEEKNILWLFHVKKPSY